ncbi:unnamed protein product [Symbiodinium necroappetens]|uniref:Major facilitator superfamily (MFS) profile domain-containing protein n=1 Tax=Symbiodinium necroappetens TaxID=1628268 RepID=A0A812IQ62_9DINO|nr:unnamed protein product [Symbiodinium necroappetens]
MAYTLCQMIFGMACNVLGPTIPWLAGRAGVQPEALGLLPLVQTFVCILSGLASTSVALVPRKHHHRLLAGLLLWLSAFFLLLPAASGSLPALLATFGAMVWPRPWISQMTSLLVANLYEDPSHGSASQSFSKGGFAAGCVVIVLLEELSSSTCGTEGTFYAAAASTALSAFLLIGVGEPKPQQEARHAGQQHPARCLVLKCCMLYGLSMGLEAAVGFWLITVMTRTGFDSAVASASNVAFYMLFAVSRLVFTPCLCHRLRPRPTTVIMGGAFVALLCCVPATLWPRWLPAVLLAVAGIPLGLGPVQPMTISLLKSQGEMTNVHTGMLSIACTVGSGAGPFLMSQVLQAFGLETFFRAFTATLLLLLLLPAMMLGRHCAAAKIRAYPVSSISSGVPMFMSTSEVFNAETSGQNPAYGQARRKSQRPRSRIKDLWKAAIAVDRLL